MATADQLTTLKAEIDRHRRLGEKHGHDSHSQGVYRGLQLATAILGVDVDR